MTLTKEEILDFIANTNPDFSKANIMGTMMYTMFTAPTQHITDESLENLIKRGVESYKKYGNRSVIAYYIENMTVQERPKDAENVKVEDILSKFKEWNQYNLKTNERDDDDV